MITIGDYQIYPAFLAILIAVPAVIVFGVIFYLNHKQDKRNLLLDTITKWQKQNIVRIIDEYIEKNPKLPEQKVKNLRGFQGYVRHNRLWDSEDILDIGDGALIDASKALFEKIKEDVEGGNRNEAVLLCHTIDFMNCGVEYEGNIIQWIGDEMESIKNHTDMDDNEARLLSVVSNTIGMVRTLVDPDIEKIPELFDVDQVLKTYNLYDFNAAISDVENTIDFRNLQAETYDIASRCLTHHIYYNILYETEKDYVPYHQIYYIRALACTLDRLLYDAILNSIDYS